MAITDELMPERIEYRITVSDRDNNLVALFTVHRSDLENAFKSQAAANKLGEDIFHAIAVAWPDVTDILDYPED